MLGNKEIHKKFDVVFMKGNVSIRNDLETQVGELKALWWWWWWTKLPNCSCLMAVDNPWTITSKWEVIELKLKNYVKDLLTSMLLLKDLARNGDIPTREWQPLGE